MSRPPRRRRPSASRSKPVRKKPTSQEPVRKDDARKAESIPLFTARQRELNTKRRGELAELAFTLKAASRQFGVSNSVA